jgi:hypothetical protein
MKKFVDLKCSQCSREIIDAFCVIPDYPACPDCGGATERLFLPGSVPAIKGDDIPGGVYIKHGVCNEDGSPRKFYSKSEIAKAARAKGLTSESERGVADKKDWDRLSSNRQYSHGAEATKWTPTPTKI